MSSLRSHIAGIATGVRPFSWSVDGARISMRQGLNYLAQPETRLKPGA
jgi:hypothetical protein